MPTLLILPSTVNSLNRFPAVKELDDTFHTLTTWPHYHCITHFYTKNSILLVFDGVADTSFDSGLVLCWADDLKQDKKQACQLRSEISKKTLVAQYCCEIIWEPSFQIFTVANYLVCEQDIYHEGQRHLCYWPHPKHTVWHTKSFCKLFKTKLMRLKYRLEELMFDSFVTKECRHAALVRETATRHDWIGVEGSEQGNPIHWCQSESNFLAVGPSVNIPWITIAHASPLLVLWDLIFWFLVLYLFIFLISSHNLSQELTKPPINSNNKFSSKFKSETQDSISTTIPSVTISPGFVYKISDLTICPSIPWRSRSNSVTETSMIFRKLNHVNHERPSI